MTTSQQARWVVHVAMASALVAVVGCASKAEAGGGAKAPQARKGGKTMQGASDAAGGGQGGAQISPRRYSKPDDAELRRRLTPLQYEVTQRDATERAFANAYWDHHEAGLYVDVVSGEPLYSSRDKFDSGTGWPSFTRPVEGGRIVEKVDRAYGMVRVEARSAGAGSHLGHIFDDGPRPGGMRHCINSAALRFVPLAKLEAEGYGAYRAAVAGEAVGKDGAAAAVAGDGEASGADNACATPKPGAKVGCATTLEEIVLAGGCFWGMEELLRKIPGVLETEVGYTGGVSERPSYSTVKRGDTGHAEAVRVVFDPKQLPLERLLTDWFFRMHDPTTPNRQGNDIGSQYRSAIFFADAAQEQAARRAIVAAGKSGRWKRPIVTEVVRAGRWTPAEDYHQDYLQQNPGGYTCHFLRD